jgi:hypothetical protein
MDKNTNEATSHGEIQPPGPYQRIEATLVSKLNLADFQNAVPMLRELGIVNDAAEAARPIGRLRKTLESSTGRTGAIPRRRFLSGGRRRNPPGLWMKSACRSWWRWRGRWLPEAGEGRRPWLPWFGSWE